MAKQSSNRHVVRHGNAWAVKKPHAQRVSVIVPTQGDGIDEARKIVKNQGGGEVVIHDLHGRIRDKDTVAPGPDPCPPKDKK